MKNNKIVIKDNALNEILKTIPLDIEIHTAIEMGLITFIHDNGFREEKMWNENNEDDNKLLASICNFSDKLTSELIDIIKNGKNDKLTDEPD